MRARTRTIIVVLAMIATTLGALGASAGAIVLPSYSEHSEYLLDLNLGTHYYHTYTVDLDCAGVYSYTGEYIGTALPGTHTGSYETILNWVEAGNTLTFTSDYDWSTYVFTFVGVDPLGSEIWVGGGSSNSGQTFPNGSMTLTKTAGSSAPCFEAPTMSCPAGSYFVSAVGSGESTPVVSRPVVPGFDYKVTASGTYYAGGDYTYDIQADAEYSRDAYQRLNLLAWTDSVRNYEGYGEGLLELKIDGAFVEWGPYSAAHKYTITRTAVAPTMDFDFQVYDVYADNNTGGLCVSLDQMPQGQITSPDAGEVVFGNLVLGALYWDDNPDGVQWAVRKDTCAAATNTVAGNVDGFSTPFSWDGHTFSSTIDPSAWALGSYCFIFNPGEGPGEPDMRLTRLFYIGELGALSPELAYNPVGTTHTVTASIGVAVAGIEVLFDIEGANSAATGTALTDATGQASFTWPGTNPGTDTVTACIDLDGLGSCDVGEPTATNTATKYWLEHYVTGGGQLVGGKGANRLAVSFGGTFGYDLAGAVVGNWQVNFHNVGNDLLDGGHFHTTAFTSAITFVNNDGIDPAPPTAAYDQATVTATGRFNGEDGWLLTITVIDAGEPGRSDGILLSLSGPGGSYTTTTDFGLDFTNEAGLSLSFLDNGNLQLHGPDLP